MNFGYPGFLFSLLAIAIPILIHLFNFRQYKKIYFSNVAFLKAAKEQYSSRENLRNLLILGCRILAIAFLVFAFARPYFSTEDGYQPDKGNLVHIYVDNSYSMESVNKEGSLLDEAKRRAKDIAEQFSPNDRFQLTTNDFEGRHQHPVSGEELKGLIEEVKVSAAQRNLQQVINRQYAPDGGKKNQFLYLISDFQRQFVGKSAIATHAGQHISLVPLHANLLPNIAVDSIWSLSPAHPPGGKEQFVVQLHNYADQASKDIPLKLMINNRQKAAIRLNIPAGKSVKDTLTFSGLTPGWQKGTVSIRDYPLTFDDELKFTFLVSAGLQILHISGDPSEPYIHALFSADPYFKLNTMAESNISYAAFSSYPLIIISGLKTPSSGLAQQLKSYMQNGGSVVLFPDLDAGPALYSSFLRDMSLPPVVSLNRDTVRVNTIDLKSNLFKDVFEAFPLKPDLPVINRYFNYAKYNRTNREDIMTLPGTQLFFSRYPLGAGQLYLSATSLKTEDSNLPQHPVFVPLLYKIAFTSVGERSLYERIGKNNLLSTAPLSLRPNESLRLIAGSQEVIPEIRQVPGKTLLYIADQIKTPGFYELRKTGSLMGSYAFNESNAESDMHFTGKKDLQRLFNAQKIRITDSQRDLSPLAIENNHTELWKLCLVLCAVFLALEVLLIRFFNKKHIKT